MHSSSSASFAAVNGERSLSGGRQRLRDSGQSSGLAVVLLEIAVESLSLGRDVDDDDGMSYVRAVCDFRRLVLSDFQRCLTSVRHSLAELYGCSAVQPLPGDDEAGAIVLELRQPRARVVSLQCDHSSGHLSRELQRLLVTSATMAALSVTELNITTDLKTVKTA